MDEDKLAPVPTAEAIWEVHNFMPVKLYQGESVPPNIRKVTGKWAVKTFIPVGDSEALHLSLPGAFQEMHNGGPSLDHHPAVPKPLLP